MSTKDFIVEPRYRRAAERGDANPQYNPRVMLTIGQGVDPHYEDAFICCRKSVNQKHAAAQYYVGSDFCDRRKD
ncbi:MAG: hypothetical protein OQK50_08205 [Deltaproteobacteria bacterium]|nr:hypothetical protein [Deltaproteobacteria bacterium]